MKQATILNGKILSKQIIDKLSGQLSKLPRKPGLAAILVGQDKASQIYVSLKEKAAAKSGIYFEKYLLPASISQTKILELIDKLNKDTKINAILVQLPLPKKNNTQKIIEAISVQKDVDGFKANSLVESPLIAGILELIKATGANLKNKKANILVNSEIFGKALKEALKKLSLKVETFLRPNDEDIKKCNTVDIVVVALGKPKILKASSIKSNAIVIDVGINRVGKKLVGDVDFDPVSQKAGWITPVPGGVGPMTVACLMNNVYQLYLEQNKK